MKCIIALLVCFGSVGFADEIAQAKPMDCSTMGPDVQQFAAQLTAANRKMFCGQFNDSQRAAAMQYTGQPDSSGNIMTSDQAVQKVAMDNGMKPSQKSPTGCPVK